MGWITRVRSGGNYYLYLTIYTGTKRNASSKQRHIYRFGNEKEAVIKMRALHALYPNFFPPELKELGYTKEDLEKWIQTAENYKTKKIVVNV